jgi:polyhydroxyalkanoate synthesis regulator phasin
MAEEALKQFIAEKAVETQRHFDVVAEDLKSTISQVAEGISTNSDLLEKLSNRVDIIESQLHNLQGMRVSVESMREDIVRIRAHMESLENKTDKKPSYADLSALDKRVWRLEQKFQTS